MSGTRIKVWVDGQCFQSASRYRGIGRAVMETLSYLRRNHSDLDIHLSLNAAHYEEARTARAMLAPLLGHANIHIWESLVDVPESQGGYGDLQKASEAVLLHHVRAIAPDIVWSPSVFEGSHRRFVSLLDPRPVGVPAVVTFHDAIPARFPDRYLGHGHVRDSYLRHLHALENYTLAMAVSEFAASELRDVLPDLPVVTVSSGLSRGFQEIVDDVLDGRERSAGERREILYVGGLDWRKNVARLVEALGLLKADGRDDITLRLIGDQPEPDVKALLSQAEALGVEDWLGFDGFATDAGLIRAYQDCDLAVQPSIMEGFGLTALEAMRAGAPLIAARAGALPEVVGDGALLFDPDDAEGLAYAIGAILDDDDLADDLRERGRARCDVFDWDVTATRVADAIRSLARPAIQQVPDRDALRADTLRRLPELDPTRVHPERLASHLAAAEPRERISGGRILIDVTSTFYANHGTGIQRVVTRIAREALAQYPQAQLVICDSDIGLEAAMLTDDGELRTTRRLTRERIYPRAGDEIILLDSSWTWHQSLELVMRDARLHGAHVTSVMYDLVPVEMPAFCDDGMPPMFEKWLRAALRYSDAFMAISEATAVSLRRLLDALDFPHPVSIGHWPLGANIGAGQPSGEHARNEFLSVATLEPRKGHADILAAFRQLWGEGEDVRLTFVGRPGWGTHGFQEELRALMEAEPRFRWLADADDAQLAEAYARAGTLIAASHAEGFGLPLIEAARHGCAVIARDIDVFNEIAPPGTRFFNGLDNLTGLIRAFARDGVAEIGTPQAMIDWAESARLLIGRIHDREWSTPYTPRVAAEWLDDGQIGDDRMPGPLEADGVDVALRILPDRVDSPIPDHIRLAVELRNDGEEKLFSRGRLLGDHAVHLSYRSYDHHGKLRDVQALRSRIPFGLGPGATTILALDMPADMVLNPSIRVEVALVQEGVAWWPGAVEVDPVALGLVPGLQDAAE